VKVNGDLKKDNENNNLQKKLSTGKDSIGKEEKEKSVKKESQDLIDGQRDVSPNGSTQKGSRLPDDWMPDEQDRSYAQNLNLDASKVAKDF